MELLDNDMTKWYVHMAEIRARFEHRHKAGCTLAIEDERVKHPARFITYCLSRLPVANIFFDGTTKDWTVIDGNKRLRTIIDFVDGKFPLEDGTYFKDIPGYLKFVLTDSLTFESYFITSASSKQNRDDIVKYIQES